MPHQNEAWAESSTPRIRDKSLHRCEKGIFSNLITGPLHSAKIDVHSYNSDDNFYIFAAPIYSLGDYYLLGSHLPHLANPPHSTHVSSTCLAPVIHKYTS